MTIPPAETQAIAMQTLAMLNQQADDLRVELAQLRRKIADVQADIGGQRGVQLLAANEQLVVAALHANAIAETAEKTLADIIRSNERDQLTNTPNRALTLERLARAIAMARLRNGHMAVLFVDIDGLKAINDRFGHAAGDAALQLTARRLEAAVRHGDTVSRYGGDEFVVVLADLSQASDAAMVATKMLDALDAPSQVGDQAIILSASIGIAIYPKDGSNGAELVAAADAAMYVSKRRGGTGFSFHDQVLALDPRLELSGTEVLLQPVLEPPSILDGQTSLEDLREANEQLVIAALTAQELKLLADEAHGRQIKFMAMVAHELRNPLTPIRMAAGLLHLSSTDEARLAHLQSIIESQVMHMARLVDDLLDGSRISTGKLRLEFGQVDIAASLGTAVDTCLPAMKTRSQDFEWHLPSTPVIIKADAVRLAQVFSNLLDNASKYTPAGGHISLAMTRHADHVTVTIRDDGIGITADALPHIFDLFVQEADALTIHSGGLGIGLAVVRELVDAHGGTVTARSEGRNRGSEFVITLPVA